MRHFICTLSVLVLLLGLMTATSSVRAGAAAPDIAVLHGAAAEVVDGEVVIRFATEKGKWPPAVGISEAASSAAGKKIALSFEAKSAEPITARLVVSDFAAPYTHLSGTQKIELGTEWRSYSLIFNVKEGTAPKINLPLLVFDGFPTSGEVRLRNIRATGTTAAAATPSALSSSSDRSATTSKARNWKALDTSDLYIKPGSALDFSPLFPQAVAGVDGRVIVNKNGDLAFAGKPDVAVRFFSVQLMPPQDFTLWTDADVAEYAEAVTRQGYNMVRFHYFDTLINGSYRGPTLKKTNAATERYTLPEKPEELEFDKHGLDRFHLLLAELKKRGVYWNLDFMTSFVGYSNKSVQAASKQGSYNTKTQMYVNENFRANWKAAVTRLLNDVNPYTQMPMKDDPALALTSCLNEQEILFENRDYGHEFDRPWQAFLSRKYADYKKMREAWQGKCGEITLPEEGTFARVPSIAAPTVKSDTPAGRDMAQCCGEIEFEMSQWYMKTLGELGFTGLTSNFNMRTRIGTVPARSLYPVITMNAYYAHPQYGAVTTVYQRSSLEDGGSSFKNQALARFLDRPFANTEFGHVFWNPYRHEQGLLHGAGAALQNWSALTCHAAQVVDYGATLIWFNAGDDPVIRASEVVETLLFRRGDVAASPHTIEIPLTDAFIQAGRGMKAIDDELSRLWVLCRVGITYGPKAMAYPTALTIFPDKMAAIGGTIWFSDVAKSDATDQLTALVARLKELKVLPVTNESDPAQGILQSDTGEVTMNTATGGEMFVRTPRLEGAILKSDKKVKLDAVTIETCDVPASITVASLDVEKTSLREATRLLLVISTDARNTDMKFTNASEDKLIHAGTLPVLARTGSFKIALTRSASAGQGGQAGNHKATAYALRLNGERAEEIPVETRGDGIALSIETAKLKQAGPTPFFEIVFEPKASAAPASVSEPAPAPNVSPAP